MTLPATCTAQQPTIDTAVRELRAAAAWHPNDSLTLAQVQSGTVTGFTLVPTDSSEAIAQLTGGTLLVNLHLLFPSGNIPDKPGRIEDLQPHPLRQRHHQNRGRSLAG